MFATFDEAVGKHPGDVTRADVAIGDAHTVDFHFDERLEPARAPGTVADEFNLDPGLLRDAGDFDGNVIGTGNAVVEWNPSRVEA